MTLRLLAALVLAFALPARADVDRNAADLVTDLVTTALGKEARLDVLSSSDVRRQLEVEANRATLGCDAESTSCLAEIAGAMGAQLVVYGKLGTLDDVVILTLNLFDSSQARAVGRVAVKDKSLAAVSDRVDGAVHDLIAPFIAQLPAAGRTKLLVLDIEPPDVTLASGPSEPLSALFWGGVGGLAGGTVAVIVGVVLYGQAESTSKALEDRSVDAVTAEGLYGERDLYGASGLTALGLGAGALVTGGVLLALSFTE